MKSLISSLPARYGGPWRRLRLAASRYGKLVVGIGCAVIFAGYILFHMPQAIEEWQNRAEVRQLAREAAQHPLTYQDVLKDPDAAKGRLVSWWITHPGHYWFYGEDHRLPILWEGPAPDMVETGQSGSSHGAKVVAAVQGVKPLGVVLVYRGLR